MFVHHQGDDLIPTTNVQNIFGRVLESFVELSNAYGNGTPLRVIMGGVGLRGIRLDIGRYQISQPIHVDERQIVVDLATGSQDERDAAIAAWLAELYDIAVVRHEDEE